MNINQYQVYLPDWVKKDKPVWWEFTKTEDNLLSTFVPLKGGKETTDAKAWINTFLPFSRAFDIKGFPIDNANTKVSNGVSRSYVFANIKTIKYWIRMWSKFEKDEKNKED